MNNKDKVKVSSQVNVFLPGWIQENYDTFVEFMTTCAEAQERIGFSSDLLQNLVNYRDFDTYKSGIVENSFLKFDITSDDDELTLASSFGFPEENGVILIDDEVILYQKKEGDTLTGLLRGASGTTKLPSYTQLGEYLNSVPAPHDKEVRVENLSTLFLSAILKSIHESFTDGISSQSVSTEINRSNLLQQVRGFFQSKGTSLGIKALFKMLFAQDDVDISYPGDLIMVPSESTWAEDLLVRTVPVPDVLCQLEVLERYQYPDVLIGQELSLRSYNDNKIYAKCTVDYVTSYPYNSETQYELSIEDSTYRGDIIANPNTYLTRDLEKPGTVTDNQKDVFSVTVETTLGFPEVGVIIVDDEAIYYGRKSFNQFLDCKRGYIGVESLHTTGARVYGPYYLESVRTEGNLVYKSRSFPLGLVKRVDIRDEGLLYTTDDKVRLGGPGKEDPRETILATLLENYDDVLTRQSAPSPEMQYVGDKTYGISGIYFDGEHVFVSSSNFPSYSIGKFSDDDSVGPAISTPNALHVFPRRDKIDNNDFILDKGTSKIGMFVDGVPAFSNVSPNKIVQGKIVDFHIVDGGGNYQNPTVLITPNNSQATAIVDKGRIVGIEQTTIGNYDGDPNIKITSGEGASFELTFDLYGRVVDVTILDAGIYYNDAPSLNVVDSSGRGRGAVLQCEVSGGEVTKVNIVHKGIDYSSTDTYVFTNPIGSGASVQAVVEYYRFNRFAEVLDNPNWTLDVGNGFLWEDNLNNRTQFGYIVSPTELRNELNDTGEDHSPILGWAYDGNPIYGPFGYANNKNNGDGVIRQKSGYVLNPSRDDVIASGGTLDNKGFNPPSEAEYPMGTFVEDYRFRALANVRDKFLMTENDKNLQNELYEDLVAQEWDIEIFGELTRNNILASGYLDSNNGKICNTPEYPQESYPDGVYAYFLTVDSFGNPEFPYILGKTFTNLPISQVVNLFTEEENNTIFSLTEFDPQAYDTTPLTFDFTKVERYRNPYLFATEDQLDIRIADVTSGSISEAFCNVDFTPDIQPNTKLGDLTFTDNSGTTGTGFLGVVSSLHGESIVSSGSKRVEARLISHHQIIDLSANTFDTFVFVRDSQIDTTSGATALVNSYDPSTMILDVRTITPNLIKYGDAFEDNRGVTVIAPAAPIIEINPGTRQYRIGSYSSQLSDLDLFVDIPDGSNLEQNGNGSNVISGYQIPAFRPDGTPLRDGDLWWSLINGRLYVYYVNNNSKRWVCTQPLGMVPLNGSTDINYGNSEVSGTTVWHEATANTITISERAPSAKPDGSELALGDLWWSPHSGALYVYNSDFITYLLQYYLQTGELPTDIPDDIDLTREWVCTDPVAVIPHGDTALDRVMPEVSVVSARSIYTGDISVIISENAPTVNLEGDPITIGHLWWSNKTGKMYIYFESEWVQCNPSAFANSEYAVDGIVIEGGEEIIPPGGGEEIPDDDGDNIGVRSERADEELLWLTDYEHMHPQDLIEVIILAAGSGNEIVKIKEVRYPESIFVERGVNGINGLIPNLTLMRNISRALYEVNTELPHNMKVGDIITITGSEYEEINGVHEVAVVGGVRNAVIRAFINPAGQVIDTEIIDPGSGYGSSFFLNVIGGGGTGANLYANVLTTDAGGVGEIQSVDILDQGINYTSEPVVDTNPFLQKPDTYFAFYTDEYYGTERGAIKYTTTSENVSTSSATIDVIANGIGYDKLPDIIGLVKRETDRAEGMVYLNGTSVSSIKITRPGNRYVSPVVIVTDLAGNGSGAVCQANIVDGAIESIDVIEGGSGYTEPIFNLVETGEPIFCTTNDIGKIKALDVINPGRNISPDRSLKPELQIDTTCVINYTTNIGNFAEGMIVYQGTNDNKLVEAEVISYNPKNQTLYLKNINGIIFEGDQIRDVTGISATVITCDQADTSVVVDGESKPYGKFIDEKSFVSSSLSYIQDSLFYQYFSYVISSPLQQKAYNNYVQDVIHPAGFIQYADVKVRENIFAPIVPLEVYLDLDVQILRVAGPDGYGDTMMLSSDNDKVFAWDDDEVTSVEAPFEDVTTFSDLFPDPEPRQRPEQTTTETPTATPEIEYPTPLYSYEPAPTPTPAPTSPSPTPTPTPQPAPSPSPSPYSGYYNK